MQKKPYLLNIAPLLPGHESELAADIAAMAEAGIITHNAFMFPIVPEGNPPTDKASILGKYYLRHIEELRKVSKIPCGILLQTTIGHGWVPNVPMKAQKFVCWDDKERYLESADIRVENGKLTADLALYNRGFSAPINPRPILLTLENGGTKFEFPFPVEIRKLYGGEKHQLKLSVPLPENWHPGTWNIGLALPDGSDVLRNDEGFAIRLANDIEFRNGVNQLGSWEL